MPQDKTGQIHTLRCLPLSPDVLLECWEVEIKSYVLLLPIWMLQFPRIPLCVVLASSSPNPDSRTLSTCALHEMKYRCPPSEWRIPIRIPSERWHFERPVLRIAGVCGEGRLREESACEAWVAFCGLLRGNSRPYNSLLEFMNVLIASRERATIEYFWICSRSAS